MFILENIRLLLNPKYFPPGMPTPRPPEGGDVFTRGCPGVLHSTPSRDFVIRYGRTMFMRHNPTPAEALLWTHIANNQLGVKFRRQHMLHYFIVDFYCVKLGLVIEIDGEIHEKQREYDDERDQLLLLMGCSVLHLSNYEVFHNMPQVVDMILSTIARLTNDT